VALGAVALRARRPHRLVRIHRYTGDAHRVLALVGVDGRVGVVGDAVAVAGAVADVLLAITRRLRGDRRVCVGQVDAADAVRAGLGMTFRVLPARAPG